MEKGDERSPINQHYVDSKKESQIKISQKNSQISCYGDKFSMHYDRISSEKSLFWLQIIMIPLVNRIPMIRIVLEQKTENL